MTTKANKKEHQTLAERANTLRAGVLGANDGILTVVGVLFSMAVATTSNFAIFMAGLSDLLACAFSMASGEYTSVSSQKDTEKAVVADEERHLNERREENLATVTQYYQARGVSAQTAQEIATELMDKDPLGTIVRIKHDLTLGHYLNPWHAAFSSLVSAASGGIFPLVAMTLLPSAIRWQGTIIAVILSVALTGFLSAKLGNGNVRVAMIRNMIIGIITMFIHYYVGLLL